jgi:VIT1/CCC1 family predicted Fe2+/Mn2+ transporter
VSNYLGTRGELQQRERARREEERQIEAFPDGEREEVRQIMAAKGFEGAGLEGAVDTITSDGERWVSTMLVEEHGHSPYAANEVRAAAATFAAFVVIGFVPLAAFVLDLLSPGGLQHTFVWSAAMTGAAFFLVGAIKSRFVAVRWWAGGFETLGVGGAAATLAYLLGTLLQGITGV